MNFDNLYELVKYSIKDKQINNYTKLGHCVCLIVTDKGNKYFGYSLKSLSLNYCAEETALLNMVNNGENNIKYMITITKKGDILLPCGKCRELISDIVTNYDFEIACGKNKFLKFRELLPYDQKVDNNYRLDIEYKADDKYQLQRFIEAQEQYYDIAYNEILSEHKQSHWMWFIFPIFKEYVRSLKANFYALKSVDEAIAYYNNDYLRKHLDKIVNLLLKIKQTNMFLVFGYIDETKLHICLTIFKYVSNNEIYQNALDKFFHGEDYQGIKEYFSEVK